MISKHSIWLVTCDNCGKTMRTNAATERIARETAQRKGWSYIRNTYIYCPKCRIKFSNPQNAD